ncbi:hypothetical protein [Pseudomonas sp. R151218B TE3479]
MFELNDMPPDLPARLHLQGIDGAQDLLACLLDQLAEFTDQWRELRVVLR